MQIDIPIPNMTKNLGAVERARARSTISVLTKGATEMYSLEAVIVHYWQRKTLSEEELLDAADVGRVVFRTWLGFAGFALLILCLSWGAQPNDERRPQVATAAQMNSLSADGQQGKGPVAY